MNNNFNIVNTENWNCKQNNHEALKKIIFKGKKSINESTTNKESEKKRSKVSLSCFPNISNNDFSKNIDITKYNRQKSAIEAQKRRKDPIKEMKFFRMNNLYAQNQFFDKNFSKHKKLQEIFSKNKNNNSCFMKQIEELPSINRKRNLIFDKTRIKLYRYQ